MSLNSTSALNASNTLKRLSVLVQLALAGIIIWLLVRIIMAYLAPESVWQTLPSTERAVPISTAAQTRLNTSFDPFHRDITETEFIESSTDAPETTLNLKLLGRRVGKDGSAILQTPDRAEKAYQVGEEILDGVTLEAVHTDYIVLSQGGRIERLTFARESEGLVSPSEGAQHTNKKHAGRTALKNAAPQVIDASSLMRLVSLSPVREGGRLQGYRLMAKSSTLDLASVGLQNGDVISAIDNINLTAPRFNPAGLASTLSNKQSITLQVKRGGRLLNVKLGS